MNKEIGQRIKQRRKDLNLTQIQVKDICGISNGNLSDFENGNKLPSAEAIIALSKVLQTTTDWILTGECNYCYDLTMCEKNSNGTIGNRIKQRRKQLHLTQSDIKKESGISTGNLSEIENGNILPSANALMVLSRVLDVSTDWILFGENITHDNSKKLNETSVEYNCLSLFNQLSSDDQEEIIGIMDLKIKLKLRRENN